MLPIMLFPNQYHIEVKITLGKDEGTDWEMAQMKLLEYGQCPVSCPGFDYKGAYSGNSLSCTFIGFVPFSMYLMLQKCDQTNTYTITVILL